MCSKKCPILMSQIRETPVSFCLLISLLLFEEFEWSWYPGMTSDVSVQVHLCPQLWGKQPSRT